MIIFALKKIKIEGAVHQFYALVKNDKCLFDDSLKMRKKKFNIPISESLRLERGPDELMELETLIEDISLGNMILPKCHSPMKSASQEAGCPIHKIRTKKTNLRCYYFKERNTGKIIVLGHIKGNEKDQKRILKKVVRHCKDYHNYKIKNKVKIIQ